MYAKGRKKGTVRFSLNVPAGARRVEVAGEFNDWSPKRMRKSKDGAYVSTVEISRPGSYQYKYLVDSQWMTDPDNGTSVLGPLGINSVAEVE